MSGPPDERRVASGDGSHDGGNDNGESNEPTYRWDGVGGATRRSVLGSLAGAFVTMGLSAQTTALDSEPGTTTIPGTSEDSPWPESPGDRWQPGGTAGPMSQHCPPETLEEEWRSKPLELSGGTEKIDVPRDDSLPVYVSGSNSNPPSGNIYALDRETGEVLSGWPVETDPPPWVNTEGGDLLYYAELPYMVGATTSSINAIDAQTGESVWETELSFTEVYPGGLRYDPSADILYVVNSQTPTIVALDGSDGSPLWDSQIGEQQERTAGAYLRDSKLYIASATIPSAGTTGYFRAIDVSAGSEGQQLWSVTEEGTPAHQSTFQDSVVTTFSPLETSEFDSFLLVLDQADGTEKWRKTRSDDLNWADARFIDSWLYATAGYATDGSYPVTKLDPDTGATEWEYDPVDLAGYQIGEDRVYAANQDGTIVAIDDDPGSSGYGGAVWSETIGNGSGEVRELRRLILRCGRLYTATGGSPGVVYTLDAADGSTLDTFTVDDGTVRDVFATDGSLWVGTFFEPELGDEPQENYVYKLDDGSEDPPAPEASVGLDPTSGSVAPDGQRSFGVLVEGAENGVGSYEMVVEVGDISVASITDVSPTKNPASTQIDIAGDGSSANVSVDMGANGYEAGDATVADLTIEGEATGSTTLSLSNVTIRDTGDGTYDVTDVSGASVTVTDDSGPPPVAGDDPPRDLDGDGLYEDIDGDGEFTIQDVQLFFQNRDADAVQNNAEYFNFDGQEPPDVSVGDVQALFQLFTE